MTILGLPQPEGIKVTTTTTGTGTVTLGSSATGFMGTGQLVDGKQYFYTIYDVNGTDVEFGLGTYTASGTTLSRDAITKSKISGTEGTTKLTLSATGSTVLIGMSGAQAGSLYALGYGGIAGMSPKWTSNTVLGCGPGAYYVESLGYAIYAAPADITPSSPSTSTMYHVYGTPTGTLEASTTAPVAFATPSGTARSKSGDASRGYLYSSLTDGSSHFYQFQYMPRTGIMRYIGNVSGGAPYRVLANGTATSQTAVDCTGIVPVTATELLAELTILTNPSSDVYFAPGAATATTSFYQINASFVCSTEFLLACDTSQKLSYLWDTSPGAGAYLDIHGYGLAR